MTAITSVGAAGSTIRNSVGFVADEDAAGKPVEDATAHDSCVRAEGAVLERATVVVAALVKMSTATVALSDYALLVANCRWYALMINEADVTWKVRSVE